MLSLADKPLDVPLTDVPFVVVERGVGAAMIRVFDDLTDYQGNALIESKERLQT
jgi:hypothetical protein